jgi:hypothetical protein
MGIMPYGAKPILEARKQGKRPKDMILISMVGPLQDEINPVVVVSPNKSYDWRWIRGLVACFWSTPAGYEAKHILDCSNARPSSLLLWDAENQKGYDIYVLPTVESIHLPREQWDMKINALRWLPFQEKQFATGEKQFNPEVMTCS